MAKSYLEKSKKELREYLSKRGTPPFVIKMLEPVLLDVWVIAQAVTIKDYADIIFSKEMDNLINSDISEIDFEEQWNNHVKKLYDLTVSKMNDFNEYQESNVPLNIS